MNRRIDEAEVARLRQVAADHLWLLRADDASCTCEAGDVCPLCRAERAVEGAALPEASAGVRALHALGEAEAETARLRAELDGLVHALVHGEPTGAPVERLRREGRGGYAPHDGDCDWANGSCVRCGRRCSGAEVLAAFDAPGGDSFDHDAFERERSERGSKA